MNILNNNLYMIKYIWKSSPARVILAFLESLSHSLMEILFSVILLKYIIDGIQFHKSFGKIIFFVSLTTAVILLLTAFSDWYHNVFVPRSDMLIMNYMQSALFRKAADMDLSSYDDPDFYDRFSRAVNESDKRAIAVLNSFSQTVSSAVVIFGMVTLLSTLDPVLNILAVAPIIFSLPLSIIRNKFNYRYNIRKTKELRKIDYVKRVFYQNQYAKEIRLSQVSETMLGLFESAVGNILTLIKKLGFKAALIGFWESFNQIVIVIYASYLYLIYRIVVTGALTIGDFTAMFNAVRSVELSIRTIMQLIPDLQEHSMYVENFKAFIDYVPKINKNENGITVSHHKHTIDIQNVSFMYDGKKEKVLKNISLTIKPNEKIALVGLNGAGKTTLVKLIMRLYDPVEGEILLDGINIKKYNLASYRFAFGAVFQDYQIFALSIAQNVLMRDCLSESDINTVNDALTKSGASDDMDKLGYTAGDVLTREFNDNGIILSGGQSQKIAIARAFAQPCDIVILDEPSSALDPIAEYNLNNQLIEIAKNKTVVFISHRLSTTRMADKIYLLDHGSIVESGSHDDLMKLNGRYAEMFRVQSERYI